MQSKVCVNADGRRQGGSLLQAIVGRNIGKVLGFKLKRVFSLEQRTLLKCTGCFFNWYPPEKLKYGKPRLGESTLM